MNPSCSNHERSSGFSLIELMLAMLIGLIIMGGVMQLFISTRDTQRSSEDQLTLLADARFAIDTIAYDLRHTGLWGRHNDPAIIACQSGTSSYPCPAGAAMPVATDDCAVGAYINIAAPLFATNNNNTGLTACASDSYKGETDVLSLRYADSNKIDTIDLVANVAYLRTTASVGMLFVGPTFLGSPYNALNDPAKYSNHRLVSRVYYVSSYTDAVGDGQPSLRRGDLVAGPSGPAMNTEVLLPGVEDFQLEFGVDLGADGVAGKKDGQVDSYVNADDVANWSNGEVLSVRIWLLMRGDRQDRDNIGSAQTFSYAGKNPTIANDGYSRRLISSVVKLRNTFQVNLKQAGS